MCAPATCCDIPALHACSHHGARTGVPGSDVHAGGNMLLMGWAQYNRFCRCSIKLKQKTRLWLRLRLRQFILRANSPCFRSESTRSRLWLDANTAPVDRRLSFGERMNVGGMAKPETPDIAKPIQFHEVSPHRVRREVVAGTTRAAAAMDDADAIRAHQLRLHAAATRARNEKKRADMKKAERARERVRETLKANCWECWRSGQDILQCKCGKRRNITDYCPAGL